MSSSPTDLTGLLVGTGMGTRDPSWEAGGWGHLWVCPRTLWQHRHPASPADCRPLCCHSKTCMLLHERCYAVLEEDPQHPVWQLCIHPMVGWDGCDSVFHRGCLQHPVAKDLLQLPMDLGLQGVKECGIVLEMVQPVRGLEAAHRTSGYPFC